MKISQRIHKLTTKFMILLFFILFCDPVIWREKITSVFSTNTGNSLLEALIRSLWWLLGLWSKQAHSVTYRDFIYPHLVSIVGFKLLVFYKTVPSQHRYSWNNNALYYCWKEFLLDLAMQFLACNWILDISALVYLIMNTRIVL